MQTTLSSHGLRVAGLLYAIIIVAGVTGEAAVRGPILALGDPAAIADAVRASEALFRLSIAGDVAMALADAGLAVLLFAWLRNTGPVLAGLATAFRLVQSAILGINLLALQGALLVLQDPSEASATLAHHLLQAHGLGYDLGLFFFAVNCVLTGALLLRGRHAPRWIGVLVVLAGGVYFLGSSLRVLAPALHPMVEPAYLLPLVAETAFCLWLFRAKQS